MGLGFRVTPSRKRESSYIEKKLVKIFPPFFVIYIYIFERKI